MLLRPLLRSSCIDGVQGLTGRKAVSQKNKAPPGLLLCCMLQSLRTSGCPWGSHPKQQLHAKAAPEGSGLIYQETALCARQPVYCKMLITVLHMHGSFCPDPGKLFMKHCYLVLEKKSMKHRRNASVFGVGHDCYMTGNGRAIC